MQMSLYEDFQELSTSLLAQFDEGGIVYIQSKPSEDSTPDAPVMEETRYELRGVAKGVSFKYLQNGFSVSTDSEVTTNVDSRFEPGIDDFIEVNGALCKVLQFKPVPSTGVPCVWKFIVRKGG